MGVYPSEKFTSIIKGEHRVLAFDPGALRMGWSVFDKGEDGPVYIASSVVTIRRGKNEEYQAYKLRVIQYWTDRQQRLLSSFNPDEVVGEIVPALGFNNATQAQLANAAITAVYTVSYLRGFKVYQLSARTVQSKIGNPAKGQKATKVRVRNGVFRLVPSLKNRAKEWTKIFEEPDACAVALTQLGYSNK